MPDDFVVFTNERTAIFRFIRISPGSWEKHIRRDAGWRYHDNVDEQSAKDAFDCGHNEVFFRHK